ncbi:delta-like protein C, partial [Nephila pilipes]
MREKSVQNRGTCEKRDNNTFACICVQGYIGDLCENIEWCVQNKEIVCEKVECKSDEERNTGFCYCKNDSFFDAKAKKCEEMDECLKKRLNGECSMPFETCVEGRCRCKENYSYSANETSCEPDFCKKSPCGKNMKCEEGDGTYICFCKEGYHQVGKDCVKYDSCSPGQSKCAQKCRGGGRCECHDGFNTTDGGETCEPVNQKTCSLNCGKGSCTVRKSVESCVCPEISHEYRNKTCIDKCTLGKVSLTECPVGVKCLPDETLGYRCDCKGKYKFARDDVHCEMRLMCSEEGAEKICTSKNALCVEDFNNEDGYICKCADGYDKEPGSGVCKHKCELKQKDCLQNQALCTLDVNNDAVCICPPLLTKGDDGKCSKLAKYSYTGDFMVQKERYNIQERIRISRKKRSIQDIDYAKLREDFNTAMNAVFEDYKDSAILKCLDANEHWKCSMEIKLDKYPGEKVSIISTPTVCLPLSDDAHCMIPPNFVTRQTEDKIFHKTDPCQKEMTSKLCGNTTECKTLEKSKIAFECKCKRGFFPRTTYRPATDAVVEICEDIDECIDPSVCPNTTECFNIPGDYKCFCKDGYISEEGKSVKKDGCREVCSPNPCVHGTCTKTGKDGFSCNCDGFYSGHFCNETNKAVVGAQNAGTRTSSIVGGVLGAFLVVSIIICIVLFRKFRKQISMNDNEEYARQRKSGLVSQM